MCAALSQAIDVLETSPLSRRAPILRMLAYLVEGVDSLIFKNKIRRSLKHNVI